MWIFAVKTEFWIQLRFFDRKVRFSLFIILLWKNLIRWKLFMFKRVCLSQEMHISCISKSQIRVSLERRGISCTVEDTFSSEMWVLFIGVTSDVIRQWNVRAYVRAQIGCEYFHPINGASATKYERKVVVYFKAMQRSALWR